MAQQPGVGWCLSGVFLCPAKTLSSGKKYICLPDSAAHRLSARRRRTAAFLLGAGLGLAAIFVIDMLFNETWSCDYIPSVSTPWQNSRRSAGAAVGFAATPRAACCSSAASLLRIFGSPASGRRSRTCVQRHL